MGRRKKAGIWTIAALKSGKKSYNMKDAHRKHRGNDGSFTSQGHGRLRRRPFDGATGGGIGQEESGPVDLFGPPCRQETDPREAGQSLVERPRRSPGTEQPPPGAGGAAARPLLP